MSLIGDALKKAHLEAVRQDGSTTRVAHTPGVAQYRSDPNKGRRGWAVALIVSNVLLAAVVAAVVFWNVSRDEPAAPATQSASQIDSRAVAVEPATPAEAPPAATSPPPVEEAPKPLSRQPEPVPVQTAPPKPEPVQSGRVTSPPTTQPIREEVRTPAPPAEPAAKPAKEPQPTPTRPAAETRPTTPRTRGAFTDGQTYMRSIPVPGGRDLMINGMSVAGGKGVALINSKMVREGDRIGPFTVGTIADRKVQLHYEDITIYLKLP